MHEPFDFRIDPDTLREVPLDAAAMREALQTRLASLPAEPAARARRLGEAGVYLRILGDVDAAAATLGQALDLAADEPRLRDVLRTRLAIVRQWQGRYADADDLFARLLHEAPPDLHGFVLQHLGKSLFEQQRHSEALAALQSALRLRLQRGDAEPVESTRLAIARVERALRESS
jgi:tetratricopeptide (TPR) repeat protein